MSLTPYYSRDGISIYLGDCREIAPLLSEKGIVICDAPYSEHTHAKSRAGARKSSLRDGTGQLPPASISRAVDFGFSHMTAAFRRDVARQSARLAARWVIQFSDSESGHLWRRSMQAVGLEFCRAAFWRKIGGSPQFTGDRPAVAVEEITICHPRGKKRWNGGGKHGWYDYSQDDTDFDAFREFGGALVYEVPIVQERLGLGMGEAKVHTTQKPEALMVALVEDFSESGEIIYDFTAGFCTTGIACIKAKGGRRRFVGIELQEKYAEAGAKRLDAELSGIGYTPAMKRGQGSLFANLTQAPSSTPETIADGRTSAASRTVPMFPGLIANVDE